jgi:sec-independent protein translocase protein TatA
MFQSIGTTEVIIIAVLLVLLFGGKKLPELGRGLGEALNELRKAFSSEDVEEKKKK